MLGISFSKWSSASGSLFIRKRIYWNGCKWTPFVRFFWRYCKKENKIFDGENYEFDTYDEWRTSVNANKMQGHAYAIGRMAWEAARQTN